MSRRRTFWVLGTVAIATGLAGAGLYAADVWPTAEPAGKSAERMMAEPAAPRLEPAGPVLEAAAAEDTEALPADALDALATVTELGGHVGAAVVELSTGDTVYERNDDDTFVPASTMKILTSVAALEVLGPDHRFATTAVSQPDAAAGAVEITLVGGGDPLLASTEDAAMTPSAATLEKLADATAEALADVDASSVRLTFDDGLFSGPAIDSDWRPNYVPDGVAAPVSALSVDGARSTPGLRWRVDDPAQTAAELFAGMLDDRGVSMADETPERATPHPDAEPLAALSSPPLSAIVEYLIQTSNNDVAEAVARHVPLGLDRPGSADEASEAVPEVLADLGIDLNGVRIDDGSGLARSNLVTVAALVSALATAADAEHPELRPAVTGLPVAGFSGSLADRAGEGAAGYVRAKTGTLTGVHSLAGVAVTPDGAAYLFAIIADDADDALGARAALDDFAAALAAGMP